jgi:hypothetical protein
MSQQFFYSVFDQSGQEHRFDNSQRAESFARINGGAVMKFPSGYENHATAWGKALRGEAEKWEPSTVNRG